MRATVGQRWLARLSLVAAAAAVLVLLAVAGARSLALVGLRLGCLALTAAGLWWPSPAGQCCGPKPAMNLEAAPPDGP